MKDSRRYRKDIGDAFLFIYIYEIINCSITKKSLQKDHVNYFETTLFLNRGSVIATA